MKALALAAALLAAAACSSPEADKGREDALRDIENGRAKVLAFGLPNFRYGDMDARTGLPKGSMGCVIEESLWEYAEAYNDEVARALRDGRLEGKTLGHKVTTRAAVEGRFREEQPATLALNGAAIDAPGGRYRVTLEPRRIDESDDPTPYLYVEAKATGRAEELMFLGGESATILFDHDGTTLLVRDDVYTTYMTFDLPTRLFMQGFPDDG